MRLIMYGPIKIQDMVLAFIPLTYGNIVYLSYL